MGTTIHKMTGPSVDITDDSAIEAGLAVMPSERQPKSDVLIAVQNFVRGDAAAELQIDLPKSSLRDDRDKTIEGSKLNIYEQREFLNGARLTRDSTNLWATIEAWFELKELCQAKNLEFKLDPIKPISHYEAHYRTTRQHDPEALDELMSRSDPSAVAEFDALADEFNSRLENMTSEEATIFVARAVKLIRSTK